MNLARRITRSLLLPAMLALIAGQFLLMSAAHASGIAVASDVRLGGDKQKSRFVIVLDKAIPFALFTLADPYRVVVDLPQVNFQLPAGSGQRGLGLIRAFRFGLFSSGKSRVVIDTTRPVRIIRSFTIPPDDSGKARLVIDMEPTKRGSFLKKSAASAAKRKMKRQQKRKQLAARRPGDAKIPLPRMKPRHRGSGKKSKPVVVIDPGHGGVDPGTIGKKGSREKKVVLAFARTLQQKLQATGLFQVFLTRNKDIFIPLRSRVGMARRSNADLFISIHADALRNRTVRGATIYTLSEKSSDAEAAALAAKENRSDIIAGVDLEDAPDELAGIFIDLAQREAKNESIKFARSATTRLQHIIRMNKNPHRFAGFRVLKSPDFPSVLIELGFLSNARDEKLLNSVRWRERTARAIAEAVRRYFSKKMAQSVL
jgi:N-acetylmuramoyl-L-alanine amidase